MAKGICVCILSFLLSLLFTSFCHAKPAPLNVTPWWNYWPRFTLAGEPSKVAAVNANVVTASGGLSDEGRGPLFRQLDYLDNFSRIQTLKQQGVKVLGWIEGQGQTRTFIGAIHRKADGTLELDNRTQAARVVASNWSWDFAGPGLNPDSNETVWFGIGSFVNSESWLGPFVLSNPTFELPVPKYADGRRAEGYSGDSHDPRNAQVYDALCGKDINGTLQSDLDSAGKRSEGKLKVTMPDGTVKIVGDISMSKDSATGWWTLYNLAAARDLISHGADGFWVDNVSGWDFIGAAPVRVAFGDWSAAAFVTYLKRHPEAQAPNISDVRAYLKEKLIEWNHLRKDEAKDLGATGWKDKRYLDDPVWRAFLVFKSSVARQRAQELYHGIKKTALALGKDPDDIYVGGNDAPSLSYGALTGDEQDMVNTETTASWSLDMGPSGRGLPSEQGHSGPFYEAATSFARSQHAVVWYYLEGAYEKWRRNTLLGELLGYEALSHNTMLNFNPDDPKSAGTQDSALKINQVIQTLAPSFGVRKSLAQIAILYSPQTQLSWLTPGGFYGFDKVTSDELDPGYMDHNLGYMGWGSALEELHRPYKIIPDFRLSLENLAGVKLLIIPHVRSMDGEAFKSVLAPFLKGGGKIIITGRSTATVSTAAHFLAPQDGVLVADLVRKFPDGVSFTPDNLGLKFHVSRGHPSQREQFLHLMKTYLAPIPEQLSMTDWPSTVWPTLYMNNGTVFCDLVNTQIDLEKSTVTQTKETRLVLAAPDEFRVRQVRFFDTKTSNFTDVGFKLLTQNRIEVRVPVFDLYTTLQFVP